MSSSAVGRHLQPSVQLFTRPYLPLPSPVMPSTNCYMRGACAHLHRALALARASQSRSRRTARS
eukprot:365464-Chlamydomonas_euryale.AAC.2